MKKNKLENFIQNNREAFDDLEPSAEIWKNIEKGIKTNRSSRILNINHWIWKAAVLIAVFTSAWFLHDWVERPGKNKAEAKSESTQGSMVLNELAEGEAYYTAQINIKQAELEKYSSEHPEIFDDLKREFMELDHDNLQLKEDLVQSNANEKVIEAIMQSYRIKLKILDQMLIQLRGSSNESKSGSMQTKKL
jgi:hypothetical protein